MLSKGIDPVETLTDRSGRCWEYQLLRAGTIELGQLRVQLRRLAAEGWEVDGAFGALEEPGIAGAVREGELHVWLRRASSAEEQYQLSALFALAA